MSATDEIRAHARRIEQSIDMQKRDTTELEEEASNVIFTLILNLEVAETAMQEALDQLENERWDSPDFDPAKILRNALNPEGASA